MTKFTLHNMDTAPEESKKHLQGALGLRGRVPNVYGILAEAPIAIETYLALAGIMKKASFTPTERNVVWFTLNSYHDCSYCMAAHTFLAKGEKVPEDVIETARAMGSYEDPKLEALRVFTLAMADKRGWVSAQELEAFLAAGFTKQNVLEIVVAISHKVLSNYANHIVETPVDDFYEKYAWTQPKKV